MPENYANSVHGLILPFDGVWPQFGDGAVVHACASVLGKVTSGREMTVCERGVIRADGHYVRIGDDFFLGTRGTVHIAHDLYPTHIGDRVTAGCNSVIHACTVGSDCVFEDNVVILDGSTVGSGVMIEKDSIVFPRSVLEDGLLYAGMPAKPVRPIEKAELAERAASLRSAGKAAGVSREKVRQEQRADSPFLAQTADVHAPVDMAPNSSIFFGCRLTVTSGRIDIGRNSNIQDNTIIDAGDALVRIGEGTTFGHNVTTEACTVGKNALIGIGSRLAMGTVVEDDVMLAAGSHTLPGQHLESGWLWAGRPSRPLSRLHPERRGAMRSIIDHYCRYAQAYGQAQRIAEEA
ncbi:gamma carbonic anhydrase family protein [Rhizobium hainanense]|uniref:Carbonic anhydrase or acetyltransferase, isoleucine patch superfamily n=1 Tax=Rhizobium hainanense TaxID=52131 RepID=A0A1C3W9E2_9HYPH|nr:gamma carbonic anhydrase family protein [Rhizobium hainanense]SCB36485.1 Carbonic anhydrase or acetyltransferase, isoleucine patch superfamily [Rhizobium hainanense]